MPSPREIPFAGEGETDFGTLLDLYKVDSGMWAESRARVCDALRARGMGKGVLLMQGGETPSRFESDTEPLFRQESSFSFLFGVKEPDCFGVVEVATGRCTLFFPRLPASYAVWMGVIRDQASFKAEYGVDEVLWADELDAFLTRLQPEVVLTTRGLNADSGRYAREATFAGIEKHRVDNGVAYDAIVACRLVKSTREQALMRHINRISSEAHCWVMRKARPGMREFQLESLFQHWGYFRGGCRHQSYTGICGCGSHGATLHYGHAGAPNDGVVADGDMALLDMGAEFRCYGSDITCTFPVNGTFSPDQKLVYEAVLAAQFGVMRKMKHGVSYIDMHELSYRIICEKLKQGGLLQGAVDDMMRANLGAVFMPHGLGHSLGLDTHDVGGRPRGHPAQTRDGFKSLRMCVPLQAGMCITVEPGIYFNDFSLDKALANPEQAKFIKADALKRFRGFGGVRLEDDVIITMDGIDNLTHCPRTVADVEAVMAGRKTFADQFTTYKDNV